LLIAVSLPSLHPILSSKRSANTVGEVEEEGAVEDEDEALDTISMSKKTSSRYVDHSLDETWLDKLISAILIRMSDLFGGKF